MKKDHLSPQKQDLNTSNQAEIYRMLNRDGSRNLLAPKFIHDKNDLYHLFLSISWLQFIAISIGTYLLINIFFGFMYFIVGPNGLTGIDAESSIKIFINCFFFSVQTFSTIGYGVMSPGNIWGHILVAAEAFCGMMSVAVMSGILFARFSKPKAKVIFSHNALITTYLGKRCFIFRMANARLNNISEAEVNVILVSDVTTPEGIFMRMQTDLPLLRHKSLLFAASWTLAHEINPASPLYNLTLADLEQKNVEVIISLKGHEETLSQTIYARFSYHYKDIIFDRYFLDILHRINGKLKVDLDNISTLKNK